MEEAVVKIFCDGGARGNPGPAACAFAVFLKGKNLHQQSFYLGKTTNNVAEYNAVIKALTWIGKNVDTVGKNQLNFFLDSELVVRQLIGVYKVKNKNLKVLYELVKKLEGSLENKTTYTHVYRSKNTVADELLNLELDLHR